MPSKYHCPACKSTEVIEYVDSIECVQCNLEFFKEGLDELEDENMLSTQELKGIVDSFSELDSDLKRKQFSESLDED